MKWITLLLFFSFNVDVAPHSPGGCDACGSSRPYRYRRPLPPERDDLFEEPETSDEASNKSLEEMANEIFNEELKSNSERSE